MSRRVTQFKQVKDGDRLRIVVEGIVESHHGTGFNLKTADNGRLGFLGDFPPEAELLDAPLAVGEMVMRSDVATANQKGELIAIINHRGTTYGIVDFCGVTPSDPLRIDQLRRA